MATHEHAIALGAPDDSLESWHSGARAFGDGLLTTAQLPAATDMATRWDYAQYPCEVWAESNHTSTQDLGRKAEICR